MSWLEKTAAFLGVLAYATVVMWLRLHLNRFLWVKVWKRYTHEQWDAMSPRPRWLLFVVFFLPLIIALAVIVYLGT